MKNIIEKYITEMVIEAKPEIYRRPLFGYAKANDFIFEELKDIVDISHLLPKDIFPAAKTVMAIFLPYQKEISVGNREGTYASLQWAESYDTTNKFIDSIWQALSTKLSEEGVKIAWLQPTYHFDKEKLIAKWSHKHVAFACGLGQFGRNHLLITKNGCAGRIGTAVLDIDLEPSSRPDKISACFAEKGCSYCRKICPVEAISNNIFDRHKCYKQCQANDKLYNNLESVEVCGKCSTGPCSYIE